MKIIKPSPIEKGDMIAIIAPSGGLGGLFTHRLDSAKIALESLGFVVKEFPTARKFLDGKAGSVEERLNDIHSAFENPDVKAILCSIGGLWCNELLNDIDYTIIKKNPKIFCGYSDITNLHQAFFKKTNLVTFYGPCAMTQFGENPEPLEYTVNYFLKSLTQKFPVGRVEASAEWTDEVLDWSEKKDLERKRILRKNDGYKWLKGGSASGDVVGGCLYCLLQLKGTKFDIDYKNKILFIEIPEGHDFRKGESLNYVDSQITDLKNSGTFDKIRGLIFGRGFGYTDEEQEKLKTIIANHMEEYDIPVLFNANIGHADPVITLPLNTKITLNAAENLFSIDESGVL